MDKKEKVSTFLQFILLLAVMVAGLLILTNYTQRRNSARRANVNEGYAFGKGIIRHYSSYKGHSVRIFYIINGKEYLYSGGWDRNPKSLLEGDSISFRYSLKDPSLIITELENAY